LYLVGSLSAFELMKQQDEWSIYKYELDSVDTRESKFKILQYSQISGKIPA